MSALVDSFSYRHAGLRGPGRPGSRGGVVPSPGRPLPGRPLSGRALPGRALSARQAGQRGSDRAAVELRRPPGRRRPVAAPETRRGVGCGPRPLPGWATTAAIGLFVALCVLGFGLIAGASGVGAPLPSATRVIYVQPGENLWRIAETVAPASAPEAVVRRIHDLNALGDAGVRPGQALRVPDGGQG